MPTVKRERREPTEDWPRLAALVAWPEQRAYEELRPVVLFGRPVEERAGDGHRRADALSPGGAHFLRAQGWQDMLTVPGQHVP